MKTTHLTTVEGKLVLSPKIQSTLANCKREALTLCIEHGITVEFVFNDSLYRASSGAALDTVTKEQPPQLGSKDSSD